VPLPYASVASIWCTVTGWPLFREAGTDRRRDKVESRRINSSSHYMVEIASSIPIDGRLGLLDMNTCSIYTSFSCACAGGNMYIGTSAVSTITTRDPNYPATMRGHFVA
jgi:hypothetical protein